MAQLLLTLVLYILVFVFIDRNASEVRFFNSLSDQPWHFLY
jgi:uncharacterized integral membrane protein